MNHIVLMGRWIKHCKLIKAKIPDKPIKIIVPDLPQMVGKGGMPPAFICVNDTMKNIIIIICTSNDEGKNAMMNRNNCMNLFKSLIGIDFEQIVPYFVTKDVLANIPSKNNINDRKKER